MKKALSLTLTFALAASLLAGCSSNLPKNPGTGTGTPTVPVVSTAPATDVALKLGLAVISDAASSKPAEGDKAGLAQMDSNVVAVLVGADGVIVDCRIDGVQSKINFDATGKLITPEDTLFGTKMERGADYGMSKASSIGKEWNEQASALAAYVVGKTVAEVKGITMDETTKPLVAELATSVTISIGGYIAAIEKAVMNAQDLGTKTGDTLGLGISTNMEKSTDADEEPGLAQAYSMYTVATFGADGAITACILDGSQTNVNFDSKGAITSSLTDGFMTKNELKDAYGMKKASSIGMEWYEEAASYAKYVTGKTAADLAGIAVDDAGRATDAELAASVTLSIGAFNEGIAKAAANAN